MDNGIPSRIDRYAAREKFRTDVTDITVDARQRLNDLRRLCRGETVIYRSEEDSSLVKRAEAQLRTINETGITGKYEVPVLEDLSGLRKDGQGQK